MKQQRGLRAKQSLILSQGQWKIISGWVTNQKNDMVRFNRSSLRFQSREWIGEAVVVGVQDLVLGIDDIGLG